MDTEPIAAFLKYVAKLKYDEKPDYDKCRKMFVDGLKSLGKTNCGELEFKVSSGGTAATAKKSIAAASPLKEQRPKVGRPSTKTATVTKISDVENISPKAKNSRKRETVANDSSEDSASPSKKVRTSKASTQSRSIKLSGKSATTNSSIVVGESDEKSKKKVYNINVDLDISFDANVVVSVKRKHKKETKKPPQSPNQSIQSTDEIPQTDKSFIMQTTKIYKRAPRSSPRTK